MGLVQTLVQRWLPRSWSAAIERESRQWRLQCPCGHETSYWDLGGIRYKARGNPLVLVRCPACGPTMHRAYFKPDLPALSLAENPESCRPSEEGFDVPEVK